MSRTIHGTSLAQVMSDKPFLTIDGVPLNFEEDWDAGIGGGLWSTGLLWVLYLSKHPDHARSNLLRLSSKSKAHANRISLLELGSGNGLLAAAFLALSAETFNTAVVTDTKEHLPLIQTTFDANKHVYKSETKIVIKEHMWGEFPSPEAKDDPLSQTFDLIVGSDLAYRDELHDPLISSLCHFSSKNTVILLGVTMVDTKPTFFSKLRKAGFRYERLADHLVEPKFRGISFGLFIIKRAP